MSSRTDILSQTSIILRDEQQGLKHLTTARNRQRQNRKIIQHVMTNLHPMNATASTTKPSIETSRMFATVHSVIWCRFGRCATVSFASQYVHAVDDEFIEQVYEIPEHAQRSDDQVIIQLIDIELAVGQAVPPRSALDGRLFRFFRLPYMNQPSTIPAIATTLDSTITSISPCPPDASPVSHASICPPVLKKPAPMASTAKITIGTVITAGDSWACQLLASAERPVNTRKNTRAI